MSILSSPIKMRASVQIKQKQNLRRCYETLENDGMFCVSHAISNTKTLTSQLETTHYFHKGL